MYCAECLDTCFPAVSTAALASAASPWETALALLVDLPSEDCPPNPTRPGSAAPPAPGLTPADEAAAQTFADELFGALDRNGDGEVDVRECILAVRKNRGDAAARLGLLGGRVRQEDGSRDAFEVVFQAIDKDGSRTISRSELRVWAASVRELALGAGTGAGMGTGTGTGTVGERDEERAD